MANLNYVISGLDLLEDYPDVKEYIKNFDVIDNFRNTYGIYLADIVYLKKIKTYGNKTKKTTCYEK